ncbi:NUDIX domain-containing protein [Mucilaginibacter limnophilus]|uniref:NUDIX domain-containing protein n=1 Tax=Mucilaginibacter limnophilus TaxID=1932778 RepID=A0A3S2WYF8_9SPHI|nr:NUDIX domain-containing protein [Mucilaginibacter limnophilus]RVU01053.1 NUDIX domain-containing protein [Mucilaginibacter limnophilus]
MSTHNVRVYGLLVNDKGEVLLSDEQEYNMQFTKFPGGGLEYGEGLIDGLKREFMEECAMEIEVLSHFYTTDFFIKSAFNDTQIISVYYLVKNIDAFILPIKTKVFDFDGDSTADVLQSFRWIKISELNPDDVTFPIDQHVAGLLKKYYESDRT